MVCVIALKLPMSIYRAIRVRVNGNYVRCKDSVKYTHLSVLYIQLSLTLCGN